MRILFSFLLFGMLHAGQAQISGVISDAQTGEPLEYATVAVYKQSDGTLLQGVITNIEGKFLIPEVPPGLYFLEASFLGYQKFVLSDIEIKLKNQDLELPSIALSLGSNELEEVIIEAERASVINRIDRQVFDTKKFQTNLGGMATELLRNLPSISVDGLGEISVRGSSGFVILLNGTPVQGNAANLLSQLPANSIDRVEVITAPSARFDPEGKAGILNIITSKSATEGAYTQFNIRGGFPSIETYGNAEPHPRYGADATYNLKRGDWNLSVGANFQRNDRGGRREGDVFTIIGDTLTQFPSSGERSFDEINFSGRFTLDYTPDTTRTYTLGFYAGKRSQDRTADILYYDNHALTPVLGGKRLYTLQYFNENLRIRKGDFVLGSFDFKKIFANTATFSTSILYEYTLLGGPTTNRNLGYPNSSILLQDEYNTNDNPLHGIRLQADYIFAPSDKGTLSTGYQYRYLDHKGDFFYGRRYNINQEFTLVPEFSSEVDLRRNLHSGYLEFTSEQGKVSYSAGSRLEYMDRELDLRDKSGIIDTTYVYDYLKVFPSATIQLDLGAKSALKAAYSKRVERTTTFKMNPFPEREHSETLEQGDPTLKPEFIDLLELGINKTFNDGNSLYATAYFRNVQNLVNRVNTVYNDSILNRIYSNVGSGKSLGLEIGAQLKPTKNWSNFIGINLYNYSINGQFDNREISTKAFIYSLNANSTLKLSETASLQFTLNYLSRQVTAQGEDSEFYSPNLSIRKSFLDGKLSGTLQWQHMDLGLLNTNEQRITTFRTGEFYTTTNYIYEVDMVFLNFTYTLNSNRNKSRFIESEFGKREF